jgi:hypothetical protein
LETLRENQEVKFWYVRIRHSPQIKIFEEKVLEKAKNTLFEKYN